MGPRIAVTSALSGEGVTYIASSLAALLANDLRRNVCLVDLNWWSTTDSTLFDPGYDGGQLDRPAPGVAQVIDGSLTLDDVLIRTQGWKLSLIPAGPVSPVTTTSQAPSTAANSRKSVLPDMSTTRSAELIAAITSLTDLASFLSPTNTTERPVAVIESARAIQWTIGHCL